MIGSWPVRVALGALTLGALLVSCGAEPDLADYSFENRNAFMAACTDATTDDLVVRDVCECVFASVRRHYTVAELRSLEDTLRLDALADLPEEIIGFVADCFIQESEI